jgi:FlaG/FlaF family flagellin (archaellin)
MRSFIPAVVFGTAALATSAFGAFSNAELHVAAQAANAVFSETQGAHVDHLVGYKVWKSGEDARVKIYINHGGTNMEFMYDCHKHDDEIECHAQ